jgi:glutamate transport system substrate-binding protein
VIASFSITPQRVADGVRFSAPYLYTEQSVLTMRTMRDTLPQVSSIADLMGKRVCSISSSTSLEEPKKEDAVVVPRNRISECIADLRAGRVQAVTTDAAILAGFKHRFPDDFDHWDVGLDPTERYGVNAGENPALQKLVDLTLYRSYADPKDSRWEEAYDRNLQSEVDNNGRAPIAVGEQPRVVRPDIRELPWEDVFG